MILFLASSASCHPAECLPILKGSACTNTGTEWQSQRLLALYHSAMAPIVADVNRI